MSESNIETGFSDLTKHSSSPAFRLLGYLRKHNSLRILVSSMCEANEVDQLLRFSFMGMQSEFERTLSFRARNSDPMSTPNYYQILYAYHITKGDYRSGKLVFLTLSYYPSHHKLTGAIVLGINSWPGNVSTRSEDRGYGHQGGCIPVPDHPTMPELSRFHQRALPCPSRTCLDPDGLS